MPELLRLALEQLTALPPALWLRRSGTLYLLVNAAHIGAIGLLIGSAVPAAGAPAVVNLVYLPMSLLSGLWLPLAALPPMFSTMAPLWPAWHLGQLAQAALGLPAQGAMAVHVAVVLAIAALCLGLAQRRLRRD